MHDQQAAFLPPAKLVSCYSIHLPMYTRTLRHVKAKFGRVNKKGVTKRAMVHQTQHGRLDGCGIPVSRKASLLVNAMTVL